MQAHDFRSITRGCSGHTINCDVLVCSTPESTITYESPGLTIVGLAVERQFLGLSVRDHDILIQQII